MVSDGIKIAGDNDFLQFGKLRKGQLRTDIETAKLLMYFPWETDKKVCVWTNPPKYDQLPKSVTNYKLINIKVSHLKGL